MSVAENEFIFRLSENENVWLGGNDIGKQGTWQWADKTRWSFTNWKSGEPNKFRGDEYCLEMGGGSKGEWNDQSCSEELNAICKKSVCPKGWSLFRGNCYKLFEDYLSWHKAEEKCQENNGHLTSIHSWEEHHFINDVNVDIWIGGNFNNYIREWTWIDHTLWNFSNLKQPSYEGSGICLKFHNNNSGEWVGSKCAYKLPFVCKIHISYTGRFIDFCLEFS